jgi:hypothetical protein
MRFGAGSNLKVYDSVLSMQYDKDGLGAVMMTCRAAGCPSLITWYADEYQLSFAGRALSQPLRTAVAKRARFLRLYLEPEEGSEQGRQLLGQTPPGKDKEHPDWEPFRLCMSEDGPDGTLCFSLSLQHEDYAHDYAHTTLCIGMPVARTPQSEAHRPKRREFSRITSMARVINSAYRRGAHSTSQTSSPATGNAVAPLPDDAARAAVGRQKFGIVRKIRDWDDGWSAEEWSDFDGRTIGVEFHDDEDKDDVTWCTPDELDVLYIADKLRAVVIECYEGGSAFARDGKGLSSPVFIGSCITSLGELCR